MEYKYGDLTGKVITAAMEVHREPGSGFQEYVYRRALEIEFRLRHIPAIREFEMPIVYKNEQIAARRMDFFIESVIPVELKALANLENREIAQALNYLETHNVEIGLLINFGSPSLQVKRLYNNQYRPVILNR
jgi:GxxExxY protein